MLEVIHAHIAKQPIAPHKVKPNVPSILSAIVMKLMAKNPAARYQSALGLEADLTRCLEEAKEGNLHTFGFELGQDDFSSQLQLPDKLYGRELEQATLLAAFERVRGGATELMLVSGEAGVGKSAHRRGLAKGLREQVEANLGFVASNLAVVSEHLDGQKRVEPFIFCHLNNSQQLLKQTQSYLASVEWDIETPEEKELRDSPLLKLSAREREVLQLIIEGKSSPEIADLLSVTPKTVYTYRGRIMKKLGMTDVAELIQFAITHDLSPASTSHQMVNAHQSA